MKRHTVDSSEIISVGYDQDTKILEIEFHGNRIYQYKNVPEDIYGRLMNSGEMTDRFFAERIQWVYDYSLVE